MPCKIIYGHTKDLHDVLFDSWFTFEIVRGYLQVDSTRSLIFNLCAGETAMAFGSLISACNILESDVVTVVSDVYLLWTTEIRFKP